MTPKLSKSGQPWGGKGVIHSFRNPHKEYNSILGGVCLVKMTVFVAAP